MTSGLVELPLRISGSDRILTCLLAVLHRNVLPPKAIQFIRLGLSESEVHSHGPGEHTTISKDGRVDDKGLLQLPSARRSFQNAKARMFVGNRLLIIVLPIVVKLALLEPPRSIHNFRNSVNTAQAGRISATLPDEDPVSGCNAVVEPCSAPPQKLFAVGQRISKPVVFWQVQEYEIAHRDFVSPTGYREVSL
jgi:hypothetical protein